LYRQLSGASYKPERDNRCPRANERLLAEGGFLVLQIVNYDRIIKYNLDGLPTITNDEIGLEFTRKYRYKKESNIIEFNTSLKIKNGDCETEYNNSVELLPLKSGELAAALRNAGFSAFDFYGILNTRIIRKIPTCWW